MFAEEEIFACEQAEAPFYLSPTIRSPLAPLLLPQLSGLPDLVDTRISEHWGNSQYLLSVEVEGTGGIPLD